MKREEVKFGDIICSSDDTIIKVHNIGYGGEVHYMAYADNARGRVQSKPYDMFYGYIEDCRPATEKEKAWFEKWYNK